MKTVSAVAAACAASLGLCAPLLAQNPHAGHARPAAPAKAAAPAAARFTLETPVKTIAAHPAGKAVLDAELPGLTTHKMYSMFKGMGLRKLSRYAPDQLTEARLAKVAASLAKVR